LGGVGRALQVGRAVSGGGSVSGRSSFKGGPGSGDGSKSQQELVTQLEALKDGLALVRLDLQQHTVLQVRPPAFRSPRRRRRSPYLSRFIGLERGVRVGGCGACVQPRRQAAQGWAAWFACT
jgi:hypothetical protein